jgi:DNA repair photolyase
MFTIKFMGHAEKITPGFRGRGAALNPGNRFESTVFVEEEGQVEASGTGRRTRFLEDHSVSIIARNNSPDIPFERSVNPYRGCEHGCAYCYARPTHEYLGYSSGLDFESRIMIKPNAPALLRRELESKSWVPQVVAMSGVTDCYQPIERKLQLTRSCLEVLAEFRNPVSIVTKNHLVTRDRDLLAQLAGFRAAGVMLSITTLDAGLSGRLEPRASRPEARLEAIRRLAEVGIPTGIMVAPVIPGLNEHEIPAIVAAAEEAGATHGWYLMLTLPYSVKDLFLDWLEREAPGRKATVVDRLRQVRGGGLTGKGFGERMRGSGFLAEQIRNLFMVSARRAGMNRNEFRLSTDAFRRPGGEQLTLFPECRVRG